MAKQIDAPLAQKTTEELDAEQKMARARKLLALGVGDFGCEKCGFKVPAAKAVNVGHRCDPSDLIKWNRLIRPPIPAGAPRPMIAIRRSIDSENFDVVFVPAVEVGGMKVLAEGEALDFAMQKILDETPNHLPLHA